MIGIIGGSYGVAQLLMRVPLGIISDKLGKRKAIIIPGVIAATISTFGMFFTENAYVLLALRFLSGAAVSTWVVATVLYTGYFEKEKQASRMQHLMLANFAGLMVSRFFGGIIAEQFGHEYTFLVGGFVGLIAIILSLFITEKATRPDKLPSVKNLFDVAKDKNLMIMSILAAFTMMVLMATINTFTSEAGIQAGADLMQLGLIATIASLQGIITSVICGKLFKKSEVNIRLILIMAFALQAVGSLVIVFGPLNLVAVYVSAILIAFGSGLGVSITFGFCTKEIDESLRSAAMGFFQTIYALGIISGPVLMGIFVDNTGLAGGFAVPAVFSIIGLIFAIVMIKKRAA